MKSKFVADYHHYKMEAKIYLAMATAAGRKDLIAEILQLHRTKCKSLHDVCKKFYLERR